MNGLHHRGQWHHELNYLISEERALRVRDFLQPYLSLEERSVGRANFSYPVHNVYLDSDDLALFRRAVNDREHRCELRIRHDRVGPGEAMNLEIKRREGDLVLRETCAVRQEALPLVLGGQLLEARHFVERVPSQAGAAQRFVELLVKFRARPKLRVVFERECYTSENGAVRVTLDRNILCQASATDCLQEHLESPHGIFHPKVLLELNFRERFPNWFQNLVETFSLTSCNADKFLQGMSLSGHEASPPAARPLADEEGQLLNPGSPLF